MSNLANVIAVSFRSIMKNKRRNIFTMIGIIIGIAAVITIMSLGNGFKQTASDQFSDAGAGKHQASITYQTEDMKIVITAAIPIIIPIIVNMLRRLFFMIERNETAITFAKLLIQSPLLFARGHQECE